MDVISMVQSVGFPTAAFILMYWLVRDTIAKNTQVLQELKESMIVMRTILDKCDRK